MDDKPVRVATRPMPLETRLEELIEADPGILGHPLLLIGRQVLTQHGKVVDLLGMDAEGGLHVLELKRDRTPREVVAQVLDYGSWVQELTNDQIRDIYTSYARGKRTGGGVGRGVRSAVRRHSAGSSQFDSRSHHCRE
ncbi:endonuclease NucS domain-containing protein [Streptomyces stelliscabiei]|uniref:RecB family endonuclease NucS n=1 Tax=Streptomyces stelliscabiei TaxID=146820 RepID=A0A8I0TRD4_9ACTN|nr:endonuclease NucS domain-containing protein [Streptomyces stelliscabiei]MBE1597382.1 RecB family endonuclease NucS [Streptomyces stelliscabiei]MDX2513692.1 endonuclease NucS [Streptomyces stelliscabiei]